MRQRNKRLVVAAIVAAGAMTASACSSGASPSTGSNDGAKSSSSSSTSASQSAVKPSSVTIGTAADSQGPAPAVSGAKKGGTVYEIDRDDFDHLDPQRVYVNYDQNVSLLFTRQLTGYKHLADGSVKLVGDLAKGTGVASDGDKTWTFHLKSGLKWQDGKPVTSYDVKYGVERSFAPFTLEGPQYIQQWLTGSTNFRKIYGGPEKGKQLNSIQTPNASTIVFHLKVAHADFPFAVAMTGYAPVPKAHDTKQAYDKKPFSDGPYEIQSHVTDKSLTLVRNKYWDPKTDPIRHDYPDKFQFAFGVQNAQSTQRFIADAGNDKDTFSMHNSVDPADIAKVKSNPQLMKRTVEGLTPFTTYFAINMKRVKNLKVRQALEEAWPLGKEIQVQGGPEYGEMATTFMSPTLAGYKSFDLYHKKAHPAGDPAAAKKLLQEAGQPHPKIVYAYNQTPTQEKVTVDIVNALKAAGFKVVTKPLNPKTYYDAIGKVNNPYDVYWGGWGFDWPTGSTQIPPVFDGRLIADQAPNYAHFNDPSVNKDIDRINAITDINKQNTQWAALDKKIMEQAPVIPEVYETYFGLYGSGLGGVFLDPIIGEQSALNIYVK